VEEGGNPGSDADTTGHRSDLRPTRWRLYRVNAIPSAWIDRLTMRDFICESAAALFEFSTVT
jgi:hypothetical protein